MFWKRNANSPSEVEALLGKEDVTLLEVMDSDDIISECRVQNRALIDFLQKPNIMEELVSLTTNEPPIELEDHIRYKYPNIACELLTCDVPALNERLASDELLLDKLYHFLEKEPPLNPLLASFFSKIMGALIAKKTEQVLDFLKAKDTFISLLLKHIGTSAIMDLVLKLFTQVEGIETKQNILNWLDSQQIIQSLISMFNPSIDKDRHYNIAQLLCDFVRIARENQNNFLERADPDPLLNTLESPEIVDLLLKTILDGEICESSTVGGIQVILALLDVNQTSISKFNSVGSYSDIQNEANNVGQKQRVLNNITKVLVPRVCDFHNILLNPPKKMPLELTFGVLDPPFGQTRLQVLKLFVAMILSKNTELLDKIMSLGTFSTMLDLFFKYSWNNFLHTQVEKCFVLAIENYITKDSDDTTVALCKHLIENCRIIERMLEAWEDNDEQQKTKGVRQGYMGHLINIVNEVVASYVRNYLGKFLRENHPELHTRLKSFVYSTLAEVNTTQKLLLGGHPYNHDSGDNQDSGDEYVYPNFNPENAESYEDYEQLVINGYEGSFSDFLDEYTTDEATANPIELHPDKSIDFETSDVDALGMEAFKDLCKQSLNTFDDDLAKGEDHAYKRLIAQQKNHLDSSDSDDDDSTVEDDVNPWSTVGSNVDIPESPARDPCIFFDTLFDVLEADIASGGMFRSSKQKTTGSDITADISIMEKSPETSITEKSLETSITEKSPETSITEKSLETSITEKSLETLNTEKSPETSITEKSPETSIEKSPDTSITKKSPETSITEKSPETSITEKSPETSVTEKSSETSDISESPQRDPLDFFDILYDALEAVKSDIGRGKMFDGSKQETTGSDITADISIMEKSTEKNDATIEESGAEIPSEKKDEEYKTEINLDSLTLMEPLKNTSLSNNTSDKTSDDLPKTDE